MEDSAVDVTNFRFQRLRKIRTQCRPTGPPETHLKLIAVANRYGLCMVIGETGLTIYSLSDIHKFDVTSKELTDIEVTDCPVITVIRLEHKCVGIDVSCDSAVLAVCQQKPDIGTVASMLDIKSLITGGGVKFICDIRLTNSCNAELIDFKWNPAVPGNFSFCSSDHSVGVIQLKDSGFTIEGMQKFQNGATCVAWSPKGKQLVLGHSDGSFGQYKTSLHSVKTIPSSLGNVPVAGMFWLSPHEFLVAYHCVSDSKTVVHFVITSKDQPVQYVNLDEICFPSAQQSAPKYNFTFIQEWNVVLCSMTNSTEVGVLGLNGDTKRWQIWNLDGNGRAELPTTSGGKDSFPNGLALDLTAAAALRLDESRSLPPMPILLILSTDGVLLPFHVVNTNPNISVLTKPAEISIAGSQRPNLVGEQQPKDRIEVVPLPQSVSQRQPEVSAPPAATVNNRKRMESGCIAQQAVVIQANEVALNETVQNEKLQKQQEEERRLNDVYQTALVEELVNFQRELKDLKKFLSSNSPSLGSGEERTTLSRTLESAERRTEDLSEEMKILRLNAGALRSECFDCLANAEEAKLRDKRRSLPEYQLLMRSMPLDSDLEKKLRRARLAVRQIQDSFDNTTAKLSAVRKPKRHGTPTRPLQQSQTAVIYRTVANMQAVINEQNLRVSSLKSQLAKLQKSGTIKTQELSSLFENSMRLVEDSGGPESNEIERLSQSISFSTGVTPINSASSNRLREFLSSRSEVPHYTAIPSDLTEAKIPAYKRVKELQQQLLKQKEMAKVQPPIVQPSPVVTQITKAEIITKAPAVPSAIMAQGEKPVTPQLVGGFNLKPSEKPLVPATTLNVGGNKLPPVSVTSAISKSDSPLTALQQMTQSSGLFGKSTETTNKLTTPAPSLFGMNSNPTTPSLFSFQPKTTVPAAIETTTPTTMSESTGLMSFSFKPTMTEKPAVKPAADVPPTLFGRPALETMTKTGENLGTIAKSPELKEKVAEAKPLEVKELPKTPSVTPSPITQPSSALPILPSATVSAPTPTLPQPQKTVSAAPVNLELQPKAVTSASTDMTIKSTTVVTAAEKASFPTVVTTSLTTSAPVISTVTPAPISSIFGASVTQPSSLFAPAAQSTPISPAVKPSEPVTAQPATLEDGEMEEVKENGGTPAVTTQSSALSSFSFKSPTAPPTSTTPQSIFGPPATTAAAGGFGGAAAFGGFGLGGQPNPQNLNKNPFGSAAGGLFGSGTSSTQAQSLFGTGGQTTFGGGFGSPLAASSNTTGGFGSSVFGSPTTAGSSFGASSNSVGTSGFGGFGTTQTATQGFGSPSAFGAKPTFGSSAAFGSGMAFGTGQSVFGGGGVPNPAGSNSVFGGGFQSSGGFAAFAKADTPSFGNLSGGQTSGFGSFGGQTSPQQQPTGFGQPATFGSTTFGSPSAFGGGQQTSGGSPAFTQFRG